MHHPHVTICIELTPLAATLLATLDAKGNVAAVVGRIIDEAQLGVDHPDAWEHEWLCHIFGEEFKQRLGSSDKLPCAKRVLLRPRKSKKKTSLSAQKLIVQRARLPSGKGV